MADVEFAFDSRLDTVFLDGLYEGDKKHASTVFAQFLRAIHDHLKEIDVNFNSGNPELFRQQVHKLKPVFSFVGLTRLTGKAELIENQCKLHSTTDPLRGLYKDFRNSIVEFIPVIEKELVRLKE